MSFNFGAGVSGLARGISDGITLGRQLREVYDDRRMRKARSEGLEAAKAAREADIGAKTNEFDVAADPAAGARDISALQQSMQPAQAPAQQQNPNGLLGLPKNSGMTQPEVTLPVNAAETAGLPKMESPRKSREQAIKEVGAIEEYYQRVAAPKIYESYLEIDPEKAEAFRTWNDDVQVKRGQKLWARALRDGAMGNFDGFAKNLVKAYNTAGYYEDGTVAEGAQIIKEKDGTASGIRINIRGADGKRDSIVVNGMEEAMNMGINFLAPNETFEKGWGYLKEARTADREAAKTAAQQQQRINEALLNDRLATNRGLLLKEYELQGQVARDAAKGGGDDTRNPYRQAASPQDVRLRLHEKAMQDGNYRRMSSEQKAQFLDEQTRVVLKMLDEQRAGPAPGLGTVFVR